MNIYLSSPCKLYPPSDMVNVTDVLFSGTSAHSVKVFNFDGNELSRMEPYSSFLQQNRGAPIAATSFHPHRMILGCAARGDHHINLFTCASERPDTIVKSII